MPPLFVDEPPAVASHDPVEYSPPLKKNLPSPCLLFLTTDALFIHPLGVPKTSDRSSWLHVPFSLPSGCHITKSWSAGPHVIVLLASSLQPFHPGHPFLWNPLTKSLSKLLPFKSIWHLITLGFGADDMVVAAGFDRNIQCVIEIHHVNGKSSSWHVLGHLPLSFNVEEHDEILYCGGCFYVLCMESSMLVIDPHRSKLTIHDIPCPNTPRLISTCDGIFMVEEQRLSNKIALWKFDEEEGHWHASVVELPYLQDSPSKVIYIKGIGMSIYFVLQDTSVLLYDVLNKLWSFADECPFDPSSRPLIWEPRED